MSIIIFWVRSDPTQDSYGTVKPQCRVFSLDEMSDALQLCQDLRSRSDVSHVCISSENPNQVGAMGVDAVKHGKLPDGTNYTWKKRRL